MSTEDTPQFAQLALAPSILKAIEHLGFEKPSPIQAESIPALLDGSDLFGQAQTGTGKTAAFALPLLSRLDITVKGPQILVLTPTRELAIQVADAMQSYGRFMEGLRVLPIYGGQNIGEQLRQIKRGAHVVVATPGRILDHLRRRSLRLEALSAVVLDEADEMLRMGFIEDVETILEQTPAEKQIALFSATMPAAVRNVAKRYLREPVDVRIKDKTATVTATTQRYWQVNGVHKLDALTRILEVEEFDAIIVFVRTKTATVDLAEKLEARGFSSAALNGDMNQAVREKTVERLRKGRLDIVVATDVAARGLDVERITHVINYDMPYDIESYVHRIGRTGRAGRKGDAIVFMAGREKRLLRAIEKATRQSIAPMQLPSRSQVADQRAGRFKQLLANTIESENLGFFEELVDRFQQESQVDSRKTAAALAFLAQRERPLQFEEKIPSKDKAKKGKARPSNTGAEFTRSDSPKSKAGMVNYRIDVGRMHGIKPKNIVGAITNEAQIDNQHIGEIRIYDSFSTVDLPEGMPKRLLKHLQKVRVRGQPMGLTVCPETLVPIDAARAAKRSFKKKHRKGEKVKRSACG